MTGSGLKGFSCTVYAPTSVEKMLLSLAFARAIRACYLIVQADLDVTAFAQIHVLDYGKENMKRFLSEFFYETICFSCLFF